MNLDIDHLKGWIGRAEQTTDVITPAPLMGLAATLDRDDPPPRPGDPIPPGAHWLYFLAPARQSELGPDGLLKRGGFLPPVPLPRRMWAGGRLQFRRPLRVGDAARRLSRILDVAPKEGRGGRMVFVVVRHEIATRAGLALAEEHDIVYREAPNPGAPPTPPAPARTAASWRRVIDPDPVLLFRYSALIFNGHRIHYDYPYATKAEGYPDLVVHGPLLATLLMDLCRQHRAEARLSRFDYRATSPIFVGAPLTLLGAPSADGTAADVWAAAADGALSMTASARFGD